MERERERAFLFQHLQLNFPHIHTKFPAHYLTFGKRTMLSFETVPSFRAVLPSSSRSSSSSSSFSFCGGASRLRRHHHQNDIITRRRKNLLVSVKASSSSSEEEEQEEGEEGEERDDPSLEKEFEERRKQSNRDSAVDWISTWKTNQNDPEFLAKQDIERQERRDKILETARSFEYVFVHDFISGSKPNDAFAHMFLKDELGKLQIDVFAPDLSGVESISEGVEVLAKAIEERQTERNGGREKRPLRLIGTSVGALCCVLYASKCDKETFEGTNSNANGSEVDKLFLLGPCFNVEKCLFNYRATFNVTFTDSFIEDAKKIDKFPFVTCPTYIVSGADDTISSLEDAVHWTRQASTLLRATNEGDEDTKKMNTSSAKANKGREAGERRLLEVSGVGHRVESALPHALPRFKEFFNLPNV